MSKSASGIHVSASDIKGFSRFRAILLLSLLPLAGCIASAPGSGGGGQKPLAVTVSPSSQPPLSLPVSTSTQASTQAFTAAVSGTSNQAVTWSLALSPNSAASASGSGLGTVDSDGNYTAPQTIPACAAGIQQCSLQVAVTATSAADTSYSGQAPVNVHVVVSMSPTNIATIGQAANLQFAATVTGTTNQSVNWSAVCTGCANDQGGGAFDPNNPGLYIASPLIQGVTAQQNAILTATSTFDTTQFATFTIGQVQTDPLGTATPSTASAAEISCPTFGGGLSGATCYQVNTSCPGIADYSAYLKVNTPATPKGTVLFVTGSGGSALYDYDSPDFFYTDGGGNSVNGGLSVVQGVLNAGYTTVQVSFGSPFNNAAGAVNGWLQGPGGVRRLACRFATVAQWVYANIHDSSTTEAFCGTGNSGGSGAIGYALSEYGLDSIFNMVEPTSGPVMTRLDLGCNPQGGQSYNGTTACTNPLNLDMSYSPGQNGTAGIIDTAYQETGASTPTLCSDGVNGIDGGNFLRFQSDSIDFSPSKSPALPIPNPPTNIKMLFGGQDGSNAMGQGEWWWSSVGPKPTQQCEPNAPHAIPADPTGAGAAQIVSDITTLCVVH